MADQGRRYLFSGGGTGGHVLPNMALHDEIRRREPDAAFLYLGSRRGYEGRNPLSGIPFRPIACAPFGSPRRPRSFARMLLCTLVGTLQALWHIARFRPHVVVATGGYVSVPAVLAAWLLRRRIYIHEQNARPGRANRLLALMATKVGVAFEETVECFPEGKAVHVGYPVRSQILRGRPEKAREEFAVVPENRVALVVGGSMGARSINRGLVEGLRTLLEDESRITVIHVTGLARTAEYHAYEDTVARLSRVGLPESCRRRYVCRPFLENIEDAYAMADLVVARAGAGTVMELAAVGKPSILIPKSDAADDHQLQNALSLKERGASEVLFEELCEENGRTIARVHGDELARSMKRLLDEPPALDRMGREARRLVVPDALKANVEVIQRLASGASLLEKVVEKDAVGYLIGQEGENHELLFRRNVVGTGIFADVRLRRARNAARAVVVRARSAGGTEFLIHPRRGSLEINGEPVSKPRKLEPEDRITLSGEKFTFAAREREVEREVRQRSMGAKVILTTLGTLTSRLFGFVREACTAALLGLSDATDILAVGLTVSNFFRGVFAEMAVETAFMPTFVHLRRTGRAGAANRLFSSILTLTIVASAAVTGAAILTLPMWLPFVAPGFETRGIMDQAVTLTRIMFPYLVLISVAALLAAVLRAFDRFAAPAFSSIMFNVGVLAGLALYPTFGLQALGYGVLAGGLGQVLFLLPPLLSPEIRKGHRLRYTPSIDLKDPGVRKVGRVTPNVLADVSIQKLGSVVDKVLATPMVSGMVGALHFSMVIFRLPYGLIAQSINTVILKEVSDGQAVREKDWTRRLLAGGLNWTLFALFPVSAAMIILAEPTVRLIFEYASFRPEQTFIVANALRFYALGLVGWGVTGLCGRFFAARLEQNRATATSFAALVLNILLSVAFVRGGMGIEGLCLGTSIAFTLCGGLRLFLLQKSLKADGVGLRRSDVVPNLAQTLICSAGAAVAMGVVHAAVKDYHGLPLFLNRLFVLGVPLGFGVFAYLAVALMVGAEPMDDILIKLGRKGGGAATKRRQPAVNPYCLTARPLLSFVKNNPRCSVDFNLARRIRDLLKNRDWRTRNIAVKLVGELKIASFQQDLCRIATCRVPAPLSHRLLGGDFKEPGFVRRNAITSLLRVGICNEVVEEALLEALEDPYYEVRAEAARALGAFAERLEDPQRAAAALVPLTRRRNFEVARAAVRALGEIAPDQSVVPHLQALHYHRNWRVRDGVVQAYRRLHERRVIPDATRLLALLDDVLATSEGFRPRFPLKEHLHQLQQDLLREKEGEAAR